VAVKLIFAILLIDKNKIMKFNQRDLIANLVECTKRNINSVAQMQELGVDRLNLKPSSDSWSALECLAHLNRYGDFYIPEISRRIAHAENGDNEFFKSGYLGEYFANSMKVKEKLNKMKTFKSMDPSGSQLSMDVVSTFLIQQRDLLDLLQIARSKNLTRIKTGISISKYIKLRLGDTFRVVIYHNERHVFQAQRACKVETLLAYRNHSVS
jgi:hypothetical protein